MNPTTKAPTPTDKHVGARVKMRRMQIGMSQEKLGDALGITFQQVQKYEKGTNRIGASRLQQIAHILDVTPAFFFEGLPDAAGRQSREDSISTLFFSAPGAFDLAADFLRLSPGLRGTVADVARKLTGVPAGERSVVTSMQAAE